MRRTKEQAAETRESILRAAEDLFVERGFGHVSLDEIAAAAGVKRGAVHFHFVNKQGIVVAMCDQGHSPLRELVERLDGEHGLSPLDELLTIATDCFQAFDGDRRRRGIYRGSLALALDDDADPTSLVSQDEMLSLIGRAMEVAAAAGSLAAPWTPATAAHALHACIVGILTQWATSDNDATMVPGAADTVRALIASFRAPVVEEILAPRKAPSKAASKAPAKRR